MAPSRYHFECDMQTGSSAKYLKGESGIKKEQWKAEGGWKPVG